MQDTEWRSGRRAGSGYAGSHLLRRRNIRKLRPDKAIKSGSMPRGMEYRNLKGFRPVPETRNYGPEQDMEAVSGRSRPRQKFTERIIRNNKPPMDLCHIRALRAEEYGRLKEFLYEAIFLPDGAQPLPREVTDDPSLRIYWEGFGREPDDRALCAEAKGQIIGAIWCRMLPEGFGHADRRTPELALAVLAAYRAQGIGSRLIGQMLEALRDAGYAQISLAVQQANRAHRLYRRFGFEVIRETPEEFIMVKSLR